MDPLKEPNKSLALETELFWTFGFKAFISIVNNILIFPFKLNFFSSLSNTIFENYFSKQYNINVIHTNSYYNIYSHSFYLDL